MCYTWTWERYKLRCGVVADAISRGGRTWDVSCVVHHAKRRFSCQYHELSHTVQAVHHWSILTMDSCCFQPLQHEHVPTFRSHVQTCHFFLKHPSKASISAPYYTAVWQKPSEEKDLILSSILFMFGILYRQNILQRIAVKSSSVTMEEGHRAHWLPYVPPTLTLNSPTYYKLNALMCFVRFWDRTTQTTAMLT